jgi:hypothetical protein
MPPAGVFESVVRRMFKLDSAEAPIGGARHVKGVGG